MLIRVAPNSDEWKRLRREGIGASDAGSIWGFGFHSLFDMINHKIHGKADDPNFKMRYGHYAETGICDYACDRLQEIGFDIVTYEPTEGIYVHDTCDYIRSTPDRLGTYRTGGATTRFVFDSKNSGAGMSWSFKKKPQLKLGYWIQSQQQMMTTNTSEAFMATNFANDRFVIWHIDAHPNFQGIHRDATEIVWKMITDKLDAGELTKQILRLANFLDDEMPTAEVEAAFAKTCAIISDEE